MLENLSLRELQIVRRHLEKVNPPPILHRYRRANEWALKEISNSEVHVASPADMNDPFEYQATLSVKLEDLRETMYVFCLKQGKCEKTAREEANRVDDNCLKMLMDGISPIRSQSGLVCCSATAISNRMWAYYGDSHQGICIGYLTDISPFCLAMSVIYEDPTQSLDLLAALDKDPTLVGEHVSRRKGKEWEFEEEYRIPIGLIPNDHTRTLPVSPQSIQEVRLGAKIKAEFRDKVLNAVQKLPHRPKVIQMGCDMDNFTLTEFEIL